MAAPSPLSQSHPASDSDASDSENESVSGSTATAAATSKLAQLALIDEVEIDIEGLHPLSPEVIAKQATINIGASWSSGLGCEFGGLSRRECAELGGPRLRCAELDITALQGGNGKEQR